MSLNLDSKKEVVAEIAARLADAQAVVLAEYRGLPVGRSITMTNDDVAYGMSVDPVAAAKVLHAYAKENDKLVIKGGAMPNVLMSAKEVGSLAVLPGREELLAMLMGTMQAPVAKFVQTLNEVPGRFVRTLAAVRDQKEKLAA